MMSCKRNLNPVLTDFVEVFFLSEDFIMIINDLRNSADF
jgi:hypothetical protein